MKNTMINSDAMVACIKAFLDPKVISHDGEFATVVGRTRAELYDLFHQWPVEGRGTNEQRRLAQQAAAQMWGYPHKQFAYIEQNYLLKEGQIGMLMHYWRGWRDAEDPGPRHHKSGYFSDLA